MMKNHHFQRLRLGAVLAVSAITAALGLAGAGVTEPARRLVVLKPQTKRQEKA